MTNKKITDLAALASATSDDVLVIVDTATNTTKKITKGDFVSDVTSPPAGTSGQIQFNDSSAFGADSNLYWDNTNKRLGVGETTPTARVQIKGVGASSSTNSLLIQNSSGTELFKVDDSGVIAVNGFIFNSNNIQPKVNGFIAIDRDTNKVFGVRDLGGTRNYLLVQSSSGSNFADITMNTDHLVVKKEGTVGIGTTTPTARLHIKGSGSTSATTSLLVQNSSGTAALTVKDDLSTTFGGTAFMNNVYLNQIQYMSASNTAMYPSSQGWLISYDSAISNVQIARLGYQETKQSTASLQVDSTTQGFLPPRMTTTQKNAISSPAAGLQVYDSTTNRASVYSTAWENVITETNGSPNSVYKLWSGSAAQYAALTPDSSTLYFVI